MNAIIVMIDSLRPDHLGCYGNKWIKTPNLDQFAQESMTFDRAHPEALPGLPVRRGLMTGIRVFPFDRGYYNSIGEAVNSQGVNLPNIPGCEPIPWDIPTLAEMVQGSQANAVEDEPLKFRTALVTDNPSLFSTGDMNYSRGFYHWDFIRGQPSDFYSVPAVDDCTANIEACRDEEGHFAPRVFGSAIKWLEDSHDAEAPFLLHIDLYDPGYKGPELFTPIYGPSDWLSEREINHMRMLYAAEVTMVDTWFGKFMSKVSELDLLKNTVVIVTSDHGHQLGEHGVCGKLPAGMWRELVDCVLMVRHPAGIGAGQRCDALVQHTDICTTILNYVHVTPNRKLDGKDLIPILEGHKSNVREYATCGYGLHVWCRNDDYVLICRTTGEQPQLFDMNNDPQQLDNIASDKPQIVKRMFGLVLNDANGGPLLPEWTTNRSHQYPDWMTWSPFKKRSKLPTRAFT